MYTKRFDMNIFICLLRFGAWIAQPVLIYFDLEIMIGIEQWLFILITNGKVTMARFLKTMDYQ